MSAKNKDKKKLKLAKAKARLKALDTEQLEQVTGGDIIPTTIRPSRFQD